MHYILLLDSEKDRRQVLEDLIKQVGGLKVEVIIVANYEELLQQLDHHTYALALINPRTLYQGGIDERLIYQTKTKKYGRHCEIFFVVSSLIDLLATPAGFKAFLFPPEAHLLQEEIEALIRRGFLVPR